MLSLVGLEVNYTNYNVSKRDGGRERAAADVVEMRAVRSRVTHLLVRSLPISTQMMGLSLNTARTTVGLS
ncbi:unnamed protein product [Merluccius merluccius]